MTLRATFEIVPHGVEDLAYKIGILDIHNVKDHGLGLSTYAGSLDLFDFREAKEDEGPTFEGVEHSRQDGFMVLVRKVLEKLEEPTKEGT